MKAMFAVARLGVRRVFSPVALVAITLFVGCDKSPNGGGKVSPGVISVVGLSTVDLGDAFVPLNTAVEFRVLNSGTQAAEYIGSAAACGCTSVDMMPRKLRPGEVGVLRVQLVGIHPGPMRIEFDTIFSGPSGEEKVKFGVRGNLLPPVEAQPAVLTINWDREAQQGCLLAGKLILRKPGIRFLSASSSVGATVSTREITEADAFPAIDWNMSLSPQLPCGELRLSVNFAYEDEKGAKQSLSVPIVGRIYGSLHASQDSMILGVLREGQVVHRALSISHGRGEAFRIVKCSTSADSSCIAINYDSEIRASQHTINIDVKPKSSTSGHQVDDAVIITTDVGSGEKISIPVRGVIIR